MNVSVSLTVENALDACQRLEVLCFTPRSKSDMSLRFHSVPARNRLSALSLEMGTPT